MYRILLVILFFIGCSHDTPLTSKAGDITSDPRNPKDEPTPIPTIDLDINPNNR